MAKYVLNLTTEERDGLLQLIKTGKAASYKQTHARVLLACDSGVSYGDISLSLHVHLSTVYRVLERCVNDGIDTALERKKHKKFRPKKLQGEEEAQLVTLACSEAPEGRNGWTHKLLADKLVELRVVESVSSRTVGRTLKKMNLNLG